MSEVLNNNMHFSLFFQSNFNGSAIDIFVSRAMTFLKNCIRKEIRHTK